MLHVCGGVLGASNKVVSLAFCFFWLLDLASLSLARRKRSCLRGRALPLMRAVTSLGFNTSAYIA